MMADEDWHKPHPPLACDPAQHSDLDTGGVGDKASALRVH